MAGIAGSSRAGATLDVVRVGPLGAAPDGVDLFTKSRRT
jgi:hypothetical protein